MKIATLIIAAALSFTATFAHARVAEPSPNKLEICTHVGNIAETVMIHRQTVASKPATIQLILDQLRRDGQTNNRDLVIVIGHVIDTAYEVPHHARDRQQASKEVMMFKLYWASMCIHSGEPQ